MNEMKTAKLFIDGQEYCDLNYQFENGIKNAIDDELSKMDLTEYGQGAEIELIVEDLDGNLIHEGIATVEWNPSLYISLNGPEQ